ncbi:MAG: PqqD family protein [Deltaproteobacteria bacterium]|nr:PqqD family protein [Deltaproteobacteria bacterium]
MVREGFPSSGLRPNFSSGRDNIDWLPLEVSPEALANYGQELGLEGSAVATALAQAVSSSPVWEQLPQTILAVKASSHPAFVFVGSFRDRDKPLLSSLLENLGCACAHLRYLSYSEAEAQCRLLASQLLGLFGRERLARARFQAIPRGGIIVLGMLAQILGLDAEQLEQSSSEAELVVVDDCALSGSRFRDFLGKSQARSVIFAHLFSHPALRDAIEKQEPRVAACVSSCDLAARDLLSEQETAGWRHRWEKRLGSKRYWLGRLDHICFPWTEPDRLVWNPAEGRTELAWRIVPPELCLKNRAAEDSIAAEVQVLSEGQGPYSLGDRVFYARQKDRTLVVNLATGNCLNLENVARDMWHLLLEQGDLRTVTECLLDRYEIDQNVLESDLGKFLDGLLLKGLLKQAP